MVAPSASSPLGKVVINPESDEIFWDIAANGVMRAEDVLAQLGPTDEPVALFQTRLNQKAVQCFLTACAVDGRTLLRQEFIAGRPFERLVEATIARDVDGIRQHQWTIKVPLPEVSNEEIQHAIELFCTVSAISSDDGSSLSHDGMTFADTEDMDGLQGGEAGPSQGLKGLLYHIAEADAKRKAYEHRGIHCEGCGEQPIRGVRWHCLNCPDFDLCSTCEADNDHIKTHVFAKIKIPLPVLSQPTQECPIWYPGDPRKMHLPLKPSVNKRLQEVYTFDGPQIDAHYDQFVCIANVPWPDDDNDIKAAIDRRAFNKALTCERWPQRFMPNLVYDRMFAFYDWNNDGLIGFEEFVSGLAYLRGRNRFTTMSRALEGFDLDGDGWVERKDFLRLFRAKHEIQKVIVEDMISCQEADQTRAAMDTLRSSQPISSIFALEEIPQGEDRRPGGKVLVNGDMEPQEGTKTILDDDEGWDETAGPNRARRSRRARSRPHERLQNHLSRFEEMLDSPTEDADAIRVHTIDGSIDAETGHHSQLNGDIQPQPPKQSHQQISLNNISKNDYWDTAIDQDILWQLVEEGFHEMLNPLFEAREQEDQEVTDTQAERQKWRSEIDEVAQKRKEAKEEQLHQENLQAAADTDSLVITAAAAAVKGPVVLDDDALRSTFVPGPFVPTGAASLARREEEISQQPLDELLSATGYQRVDGEHDTEQNGLGLSLPTDTATSSDEPLMSGSLQTPAFGSPEQLQDPTMPQNMPNSADTMSSNANPEVGSRSSFSNTAEPTTTNFKAQPARKRLEYLDALDQRERQIKLRGGPGRLSYAEVEELVEADKSRELRGLVINWLEWASF